MGAAVPFSAKYTTARCWLGVSVRRMTLAVPAPKLIQARPKPFRTVARAGDFSVSDVFAQELEAMNREFGALERQANIDFDRAMKQMQKGVEGQTGRWERGDGYQTYRIDRGSESRLGTGYRREYYSESVTVYGPGSFPPLAAQTPLPASLLLLATLALGALAAVTARFASNFHLTMYSGKKKWQLLLLWPLLVIASHSFRKQFLAALRGEKVPISEVDLPEE